MGRGSAFQSLRTLTGLAFAVLFFAGDAAAGQLRSFEMPSGPSAHVSQAKAGVLVRQDATLGAANRATGMPTSPEPGRRIQGATIKIETYGQDTTEPTYFPDVRVTLAGQPTRDPDAQLNVGFGNQAGSTCQVNAIVGGETSDYRGTQYQYGGYNPDYFPTPPKPWDCVAVFLDDSTSGPATTAYDALVAPLVDTRESARLKIREVTLLGQRQKTLRLVRGVPTQISIEVRNTGKVRTGKLSFRGSGKGVKVTRASAEPVTEDSDRSASVKVRLAGRQKRTKLKLRVGDGKVSAVTTLRVVRVNPPKRPRAGSYRSPSGSVRFMIKRGRIVGWNGTMTTRCGGYPDNFTYSTNTYDFPTTKIPRNGIVERSSKGNLYSAHLRLKVAGGRVTRGLFTYFGPNRCFASVPFDAKRSGR